MRYSATSVAFLAQVMREKALYNVYRITRGVVLEVAADSWEAGDNGDLETVEEHLRANSGELEELRGVHCSSSN